MFLGIYFNIDSVAEYLEATPKLMRRLYRLGILPSVDGMRPVSFDKKEIDAWVAAGGWEKHKPPVEYTHRGVYEAD